MSVRLGSSMPFTGLGAIAAQIPFGVNPNVQVTAGAYEQCGGEGWKGATVCAESWKCVLTQPSFAQCMPSNEGEAGSILDQVNAQIGASDDAPTVGPSTKVGKLPALGWNSWNAYRCDVSHDKVLAAAEQIVSLGLKDAGYQYVNIDDCWSMRARDALSNRIDPDLKKFPYGIAALADKVHDLGLKIGIYSDAGSATCAEYPGSLGYEDIDAATFADWGIDYLKYDNCWVPANWTDSERPKHGDYYNSNSAVRYRIMGAALAAQSRPIEYNLCIWGLANVWDWGAKVGHSWRVSYDSNATWGYISGIININSKILSSVDFFAHNDMDMMEIGNGNITIEEQRTHFAGWILMKSPILLGTDLSQLSKEQVAIITNKELLAFHQDVKVGAPAKPFTPAASNKTTTPPEYYAGKSSKGTHVFVINTSSEEETKVFSLSEVPGLEKAKKYRVHDMWNGTDLEGKFHADANFTVAIAGHDTVAYLITKA